MEHRLNLNQIWMVKMFIPFNLLNLRLKGTIQGTTYRSTSKLSNKQDLSLFLTRFLTLLPDTPGLTLSHTLTVKANALEEQFDKLEYYNFNFNFI